MKSTPRLRIKAPIKAIEDGVFSAEKWLSFAPGYRGLEAGDPNWPNQGSSIVVRSGLGRLTFPIKVTVVEYRHGRRFHTHEDAFSDRYIHDIDLTLQEDDGTTTLTFMRDLTSKSVPVRILFLLVYPLRWVTARLVKKRIQAMVKT